MTKEKNTRIYYEPIHGYNGEVICDVYDINGKRYLEFENMDVDGEYVSVTLEEFLDKVRQASKEVRDEKE